MFEYTLRKNYPFVASAPAPMFYKNIVISGSYLGQITSGKWVGTQNEKRPNKDN